MKTSAKVVLWILGSFLGLLLVIVAASFFGDEPLRAFIEKEMNEKLQGYEVSIAEVDFNLLGPSVELEGMTIVQEQNPEPPVAHFPSIDAGIHWGSILAGRLVGEVVFDRPALHVNLKQLREEAKSEIKVRDRGWQDAVKAIYPLQINLLTVTNGELIYIDEDPERPLQIRQINLEAANIRNIKSPDRVYPSTFRLESSLLDEGWMRLEGDANFLAEPHPSGTARVDLGNVPLDHFSPILQRYFLAISQGRLDASGRAEYSAAIRTAHLEKVLVRDLELDYRHSPGSQPQVEKAVKTTTEAAAAVSNNPEFDLRIDDLRVAGHLGMTNLRLDPPYRVFLQDADLHLTNLSNHFTQGPAEFELTGAFMGSGRMRATGNFRAETDGPDFDLNVKIEGTQLKDMNNLLRAYGNFDVVAGIFSFYSELQVPIPGNYYSA